jgi:hypothetical protein
MLQVKGWRLASVLSHGEVVAWNMVFFGKEKLDPPISRTTVPVTPVLHVMNPSVETISVKTVILQVIAHT